MSLLYAYDRFLFTFASRVAPSLMVVLWYPTCPQAPTSLPSAAPSDSPTEAPTQSPSEVRQSAIWTHPTFFCSKSGVHSSSHSSDEEPSSPGDEWTMKITSPTPLAGRP